MAPRDVALYRMCCVSREFRERLPAHGLAVRPRLPPELHRDVAGRGAALLPRLQVGFVQKKAAIHTSAAFVTRYPILAVRCRPL